MSDPADDAGRVARPRQCIARATRKSIDARLAVDRLHEELAPTTWLPSGSWGFPRGCDRAALWRSFRTTVSPMTPAVYRKLAEDLDSDRSRLPLDHHFPQQAFTRRGSSRPTRLTAKPWYGPQAGRFSYRHQP